MVHSLGRLWRQADWSDGRSPRVAVALYCGSQPVDVFRASAASMSRGAVGLSTEQNKPIGPNPSKKPAKKALTELMLVILDLETACEIASRLIQPKHSSRS